MYISTFEYKSFNVNFRVMWVVEWVEAWVYKQILKQDTQFKNNIYFVRTDTYRLFGTIIRKYVFFRYTMWPENKLFLRGCNVS